MNLDSIKKNIKENDYISFDIFDTLVRRVVVSSIDVYKITEHLYCEKWGENLTGFAEKRKEVERQLWEHTLDGVFTLDSIYEELGNFYELEKLKILKEIELEVEKEIIKKNPWMEDVYKYAIEENKKVIMTSDMYLGKNFMEELFVKLDIKNYQKIYISGERAAYKVDASLFDVVIKDTKSKSIFHIGDSVRGDFLMPKTRGLKSFQYKPYYNPYFSESDVKTLADSLILGMINNYPLKDEKYWSSMGYSILGPLLLGYVSWIEEETKKQGIRKIIFLARDGYIVKKAFDLLYGEEYSTEYMYISRKSALIPTIDEESSIRDILSIFKFRKIENFKDVLHRLGIFNTLEDENLNFEVKREDLYTGKYDSQLQKYRSEIIAKAIEQKNLLVKYCDSMFTEEKVAVVDIGWHGTIQNSLQKIVGDRVGIVGYYLGLEKEGEPNKYSYLSGCDLFDPNMIPFTRGVYETFFSATHSTTEGYDIVDGKVSPVFSECMMLAETTEKIDDIQEGAIYFVDKYLQLANKFMLKNEKISTKLVSSGLVNFAINPEYKDALRFGKIEFNDTSNRKLIAYNKGNFKDNIKFFMGSDWKAGYAQGLFKFRIPAGRLMTCVNRLRKRD